MVWREIHIAWEITQKVNDDDVAVIVGDDADDVDVDVGEKRKKKWEVDDVCT